MKESIAHSHSDFNEVHKNPLNDSLSKNLWTFAKSGRFSKDSVYYCMHYSSCDKIYDIQGFIQPKKGAAFGYGRKSDFMKDATASPGSTRYEIASQFYDNKIKKKGYSIAIGRDVHPVLAQLSAHKGHIELEPLKVPGPGTYYQYAGKGINYSMRPRLKALDKAETVDAQNDNPGPGAYYNPEATEPKGRYYLSKFRNSGARFFNPQSSPRFSIIESKVPGPGAYINNENDMSKRGRYVLSKDKGTGRRSFDHQARRSFVDDFSSLHRTPGPGSYRSPSDFGYYDQKN